jgi:hypothetical protein
MHGEARDDGCHRATRWTNEEGWRPKRTVGPQAPHQSFVAQPSGGHGAVLERVADDKSYRNGDDYA